jgi:hypothetical protein
MATASNTSYTLPGMREDLEDTIWDLFPMDTWCLSNLDKVDAENTYHQWQKDSLAATGANRALEGDDATFSTAAGTTLLGNYQQISTKSFFISRTADKVRKAGRGTETARQAMKKMRELKRDMEVALITNQSSSAGGAATARSTGSMESWIASTDNGGNAIRATTTASASTAAFAANAVTTPTDGTTTGALTEALLKEALRLAWADGGDPRVILCNSTQKTAIDAITGVATRFVDVDRSAEASIIGSVSLYVSDFGRHQVVLNRHVRQSVILCIDPDFWAVSFVDRPFMKTLAATGDADKRMIISEFGLVARNSDSSGKVAALT